jgi:hypothetical protein
MNLIEEISPLVNLDSRSDSYESINDNEIVIQSHGLEFYDT